MMKDSFPISLFILGFTTCIIAGCSTTDVIDGTRFEPLKNESGVYYFKYTSYADPTFSLDSEEAEKKRVKQIGVWLQNNNFDPYKYEIMSRTPILKNKAIFGNSYDIYYEIKTIR